MAVLSAEEVGIDMAYDPNTGMLSGPNGDYVEVDGDTYIFNWIYHCLMTVPGQFRFRPTYGCGVPLYVNRKLTKDNLSELKNRIIRNLLTHPSIKAVEVNVGARIINGKTAVSVFVQPTIGRKLLPRIQFNF